MESLSISNNLANPAALTAADFQFKVGNDNNPAAWTAAPAPASVTVRSGAGTNGSDRVTIIWADNAIENQWLQVTVLANANTGLSPPMCFTSATPSANRGNNRRQRRGGFGGRIGRMVEQVGLCSGGGDQSLRLQSRRPRERGRRAHRPAQSHRRPERKSLAANRRPACRRPLGRSGDLAAIVVVGEQ